MATRQFPVLVPELKYVGSIPTSIDFSVLNSFFGSNTRMIHQKITSSGSLDLAVAAFPTLNTEPPGATTESKMKHSVQNVCISGHVNIRSVLSVQCRAADEC